MIRDLTIDDLPELLCRLQDVANESGWILDLDFDARYLADQLITMIRNPDHMVIGTDDGGALMIARIGPMWYTPSRIASEQMVYVHPQKRGQGVARAMLSNYKAWARERGAAKAMIGSSLGIAPEKVRQLYESEGFRLVGHVFECVWRD